MIPKQFTWWTDIGLPPRTAADLISADGALTSALIYDAAADLFFMKKQKPIINAIPMGSDITALFVNPAMIYVRKETVAQDTA